MIYIALLRGINVGGHRVKMDRLQGIFAELGCKNVSSYIQSGNIFFESERTDRDVLTQEIEQHLFEQLHFEVPTFLRTIAEIEELIAANPFVDATASEDKRLCVLFTSELIPDTLGLPMRSIKNDVEIIKTTRFEAFMVWHLINGKAPSNQSLNLLGYKTTIRFLHTLVKILEAVRKYAALKRV